MEPKNFVLQWHITERCNWRCKHCYQENYDTPEMKLKDLFKIRDQFIDFLNSFKSRPERVRINITGGEPFARSDIMEFLAGIAKYKNLWSWSILSNGSLLDKEKVKFIKSLGIYGFQVSIEGMEKTNDEIRGRGAFKKTIKAIELLKEAGIRTIVSLTLSKQNKNDVFSLAKFLAPLGVKSLSARRIVPWGHGAALKEYLIEPQELYDFYREIEEMNIWFIKNNYELRVRGGCESGFFFDEASIYPETGETLMTKNTCGVKDGRIIVVMPDGIVLPCRRLPIPVGKLFDQNLIEIWNSQTMKTFRDPKKFTQAEVCRACPNWNNCRGGALCVNYGYLLKLDTPDVQCHRAFSGLDAARNYLAKNK